MSKLKQTISISDSLKKRIDEYISSNHKKFPKDKRFKSTSAFYDFVMKKSLKCFEKGKSLDDFEKFADREIVDLFDQFSFRQFIPIFEPSLEMNRYTKLDINMTIRFLYSLKRLAYQSGYNPYDIKTLGIFIERLGNYIFANRLTKDFKFEIIVDDKTKNLKKLILELTGIYKNITFENFKLLTAVTAVFGAKIVNLFLSLDENYCRLELEPTSLYFEQSIDKKKTLELVEQNLSYLVNYSNILNDNHYYLWMKMAIDKDISLAFNNEKTRERWINLIVKEIKKYGENEILLLNILRLFEAFHWINIEDKKLRSFRLRLSEERNKEEVDFLINLISNYGKISKINEIYYLEQKK
ncbi:MAG: hypothetical protein ACFE8V_09425 [Promethearchaeota archaeon]